MKELKEGVKIGRLWYNLRNPVIQSYSTAYEQVKRDADIEEEKAARLKAGQLEGLKKKENKVQRASGPIRNDKSSSSGGSSSWTFPYQPHPRQHQFQHSRIPPPRSPSHDQLREPNQQHKQPQYNASIAHYPPDARVNRSATSSSNHAHRGFPRDRTMQMIDQNPMYQQFTPLKVHLEELYHMIKDRGLLYPLIPIANAPNKQDMSRFCKFYSTHGHTTAQCWDLKN